MKKLAFFIALIAFCGLDEVYCQWNTNGNHIYNTNPGFVGIGTNSPATLLYVAKNMTEPNITVRNLGGTGGATYTMTDDASGANWKFKATLAGGFKIRDHAHSLDVIVIEPGSFANAIYIKNTDNIGIGTSTPASSAVLDVNSTTKGMLIPRMTVEQMMSIADPDDGLQVYCTSDGKLYIYVALANLWKEIAFGSGVVNNQPFTTCGDLVTVNHTAGDVAPVNKVTTYGTWWIGPQEELCWITKNLGSDHQPTAPDDVTEASSGWYWQFNRKQGYKHDGTTRTPDISWPHIDENSDWTGANDPCALELGDGWRIPTFTEWQTYKTTLGWTDWNLPWSGPLKLHAGGILSSDIGSPIYKGTYGDYWSSTQYSSFGGYFLYFGSFFCGFFGDVKDLATPVRCVKFIPY